MARADWPRVQAEKRENASGERQPAAPRELNRRHSNRARLPRPPSLSSSTGLSYLDCSFFRVLQCNFVLLLYWHNERHG